LTNCGDTPQETPGAEKPALQVKLTVPVNPLVGVTVIVPVPVCPGAGMVRAEGFADRLKSARVMVVVEAAEVELA
jgi:hypothetical protein